MRRSSVASSLALLAVLLVVGGCGSTKTVTVTSMHSTSAPASTPAGSTYTSPVQLPLPFDSEENAFMGDPDPRHNGVNRTGCFAIVITFDRKSEEVCDCAYRALRALGHPASQLAAISSALAPSQLGPEWFNVEITRCWANLDPNG
jgi:hypothetical protein